MHIFVTTQLRVLPILFLPLEQMQTINNSKSENIVSDRKKTNCAHKDWSSLLRARACSCAHIPISCVIANLNIIDREVDMRIEADKIFTLLNTRAMCPCHFYCRISFFFSSFFIIGSAQ